MKKIVFGLFLFSIIGVSHAVTTATMVGVDGANTNQQSGVTTINVLVAFTGTNALPFIQSIPVQTDLNQNPAQIQSDIAAAIRAFATQQGFTIPVNNVNLINFTKG